MQKLLLVVGPLRERGFVKIPETRKSFFSMIFKKCQDLRLSGSTTKNTYFFMCVFPY